jgi:hypothetical protein
VPLSPYEVFAGLVTYVGGLDELLALDRAPLPEEPFDWSVVDAVDRAFVERVLALSEEYCRHKLDAEFVTITRRILARVAARDPRVFRRRADAARCAASLVWLAGRANGYFGRGLIGTGGPLWGWFGVTDCAPLGKRLRQIAGLDVGPVRDRFFYVAQFPLGDATLLHSPFRNSIIRLRDLFANAAGLGPSYGG